MTTTNVYGRQVVVPLTNKSGGGVIAGDVVVVDTANNDAFTTSTSGAFTGGVGVAQETIASNAVGRVLIAGYAALVLTSASVTRGNFGKTHTVAKQAVDAGAARTVGTFCQFLTGGTTPDAIVYPADLSGGAPTLIEYTLGADVTMTTANVFYDGPSGTPAAGTYDVLAFVSLLKVSASSEFFTARLVAGATVIDEREVDNTGLANTVSVIPLTARIVLDGGTAIKITAVGNARANNVMERDASNGGNSSSLHRATIITLRKVA